jgi:hypothetical protein
MGHGRAIINIEDLDAQTGIYQKIEVKICLCMIPNFGQKLSKFKTKSPSSATALQ